MLIKYKKNLNVIFKVVITFGLCSQILINTNIISLVKVSPDGFESLRV